MIPVFHEHRRVGVITGQGAALDFSYDPDWTHADDAFPVSAGLPFAAARHDPVRVTNWFANLLPEDAQLRAFARLNRAHPADLYTLLEKTGREAAGALSIGAPEADGEYLARTAKELEADLDRLPERPLLAGQEGITLSLAGAQPKMVAALIGSRLHIPLNGAASTHILKPANRLYASIENEALCMRLAKAVGIDVAEAEIGAAQECPYLRVRRYDRAPMDSGKITRLHQEDAAQALGLSPLQKYEANGGPGLKDLFSVIDQHSHYRVQDRLELRDRIIFNACIANTDAHAKNFSFMISGGYRLAPAYDLLSAAPYAEITHNMAMKIGGQKNYRHIGRKGWIEFARECRLAPAATVRRVEAIADSILGRIDAVCEALVSEGNAMPAALDHIRAEIIGQTLRIQANLNSGQGQDLESFH